MILLLKGREHVKTDARVKYTRKIIQDVFVDCLKEKPVHKITVKEICDKAEINRSTFYKHYQDCYDLLEYILQEALDQFHKDLMTIEQSGEKEILLQILRKIQMYVPYGTSQKNEYVIQHFIEQINACAIKYMIGQMQLSYDNKKINQELFSVFLLGGSKGLVDNWIKTGMKETPEELAEQMLKIYETVFKI